MATYIITGSVPFVYSIHRGELCFPRAMDYIFDAMWVTDGKCNQAIVDFRYASISTEALMETRIEATPYIPENTRVAYVVSEKVRKTMDKKSPYMTARKVEIVKVFRLPQTAAEWLFTEGQRKLFNFSCRELGETFLPEERRELFQPLGRDICSVCVEQALPAYA